MPRRTRSRALAGVYHITHRCYNKEFLFRFKRDCDIYVDKLREMTKRYLVAVLDYMVTSNHVYLLVSVRNPAALSAGLGYLHGQVAREYNKQNKREGAFWTSRFYSTLIQDGEYLGRCLFYIDLNMVRTGKINCPEEWKHTAYHEFTERKKYKRIVNMDRLLKALMISDIDYFRRWYEKNLELKLTNIDRPQEKFWSQATAVGDEEWLNRIRDKKKGSAMIHDHDGLTYLNYGRIK